MTNNIKAVCPENGAYKYRPETDVLFRLPDGAFRYSGIIDSTIRYIQSIQLKRTDLWKAFVEQFRTAPDSDKLTWKGEYWGKMMRGAVFTYQYTQDEELYNILCDTVRDLMTAQDSLGRICTYSTDTEFDGWDLWCRKYVLLGFQYFLDICKDDSLRKEVIETMKKHADYIMAHVGSPNDGKKEITSCTRAWMGLNSSSILEPYVRLYNLTCEQKYLDYAKYIVDCGGISEGNIFELAYEDKLCPYEYPTTKAYEMMSCFEGLLEYYRVTRIEKYKTSVVNFAKKVLASDITLIGCSGCTHELFDNSAKRQTATDYNDVMQETCVTVTWMKFCHQVLSITGDSSFADALEISTYNAMLGSINSYGTDKLNGFPFESYAPLFMDIRAKRSGGYQPMEGDVTGYGCCACIGSAGTALMGLSSVMQSADGLYMNLYVPGVVSAKTPAGTDISIKIDTEYPVKNTINMFVQNATGEEEFSLYFRIPSWCDKAEMSVCGEKVDVVCGTYAKVTRKWKCCDKITLVFDMPMKAVLPPYGGSDENSKYLIALCKGPIVFARDARFGETIDDVVDIDYDENMIVNPVEAESTFDTLCTYKIPNKNGTYFTVCDFQSAGKTWDADSYMTVWMVTKTFWNIDLTKKFELNTGVCDFAIGSDGTTLVPVRGDRPKAYFICEENPDGTYYMKNIESGKYVTAEKYPHLDRYYLVLRDKGADNQTWKFDRYATNRYRMINAALGTSVVHAYVDHDIFILSDYTKNDVIKGFSYANTAFVDIRNI